MSPPSDISANLARKISFRFILRSTDVVFTLIASVIVARLLGPEVLGTFSSALAICMLFSLVANDGLGTAHLKIINSAEKDKKCLSSFITVKLCFIFLCILLLLLHLRFSPLKNDSVYYSVLVICSAVVVINQIAGIFIANFDAHIDSKKSESVTFLGSFVRNILKICFSMMSLGAIALGYAELSAVLITFAAAAFLSRKYHFTRPSLSIMTTYAMLSLPLFINTFARGAVVSLDKAMIKYFFPTTFGNIEVGIYAAGQRLGSLIQFFSFITAITLFPIFSNLSANGNFTRIKEIIINFENTAIVILMPIVISLAVFSLPIILFLVGAEYRASAAIMQITILGLFGIMLFQPYINFIIGGKNLILLGSLIHVIFLLTNIILNFIFIPETVFGMKMMGWCSLGAALASTASYVILGVIAKMIASKYIHVSTFKKYGYEFIFLIFISVLFIFIIDQYKLEKIIHACFGIPVFLFLFWATVYICKRDHFSKAIHNLEKIFPKSKSSIL